MKLILLGTGHAGVTECYNTCFVLREGDRCLLVDGGGGNGLLRQLKRAGLRPDGIREVFVTHRHTDHLIGILWLLREYAHPARPGEEDKTLTIYSHREVIEILRAVTAPLFPGPEAEAIRSRVKLVEVRDGETRELLGRPVTFFDLRAEKAAQFGFSMVLEDGGTVTCCGDEPCGEGARPYARGCRWLLHEAFCLEADAERYHPHRLRHSTVRDACETAEALGAENLILYHTEDQTLPRRKEIYTREGARYYHGNLYVPDDLEELTL